MKTLTCLIVAVFAVGLVACSGGDDGGEGHTAPPATQDMATCPPTPTASAALAASPTAKCVGRFEGSGAAKSDPRNSGPIGRGWLHRTAEGCTWSTELLLREDGTATNLKDQRSGTWTGDEFYFTVEFAERIEKFIRTEGEASK